MWIFETSQNENRRTIARRRAATFCIPVTAGTWLLKFASLLAAFWLIPSAEDSHARGLYEVREVKPGVYAFLPEDVTDADGDPQFSRRANAGFVVTSSGAVVINTMNTPFRASDLLYEIRRRNDPAILYVINTDSHPDVFLGNQVFTVLKATVIATGAAREEMEEYASDLARRLLLDENYRLQARMRGIHPTAPTQTFETELTIQPGGQEVRIVKLAGGHSRGDAVVYLPDQKVLFLGHLYENGFFPRLDQSNVHRWIEILKEVESWDVEVYVPARGVPSGKKEVADFRQFLEWLWNEVSVRVQEGKSVTDVKRELKLTETYRWSARELAPRAVEEIYQQILREQPPVPAAARSPLESIEPLPPLPAGPLQ